MSDHVEQEARSIQEVQESGRLQNAGNTKQFFQELRVKLPSSRLPQEIAQTEAEENENVDEESLRERAEDNPFLAYLLDVGHLHAMAGREISSQIEREYKRARAKDIPLELICCVVRGLYEVAVQRGAAGDIDSFRKVAEEDVTKWLLIIRSILETINNDSIDAGINFEFEIAKIDVSALIFESIEDLVALTLGIPALVFIEETISRINRTVMDAIGYAKCGPIIRLWNTVLKWLYGASSGVIGRIKGFVQDVLVRLHRKIGGPVTEGGSGEGRVGTASGPARWEFVEDMIVLINFLLNSLNLFRTCRLPYDSDLPGGGRGGNRTGTGSGDDGDDDSGDDGGGGGGDDGGGGGRGRNQLRPGFEVADDPDLGEIQRQIEDSGGRSYLYFTPENIGKFASLMSSASAREARDMSRAGGCAEELSSDTQDFLRDLGVLPDE